MLRWARWVLLVLAVLIGPPAWAATQTVQVLSHASLRTAPKGGQIDTKIPAVPVQLSHRWDETEQGEAGQDGVARYELLLDKVSGEGPRGLLFSRIGNQASVRVNGELVGQWGTPGDTRFDAAKTSWLISVPASLLTAEVDRLQIDVWCQSGRWGGLSRVKYGLLSDLEPEYGLQRIWRFDLPLVVAAVFLLMGIAAFMLWRKQRVSTYAWFSAAALLGVVVHLDKVWPDVPFPWPQWGMLRATAYGCHLVLMFRVALEMLEVRSRLLHQLLIATIAGTCVVAALSFGAVPAPAFWGKLGLPLLVPYGLLCALWVTRAAWPRRQTLMGGAMLACAWGLTLLAVFDLVVVKYKIGGSQGGKFSLLPLGVFAIAIVMMAVILARYNAAVEEYRRLNQDLAKRVAEREQQLREAFDSLQDQNRAQAVQEERQRLMREIHDGVGAQLVLLLNLASQGKVDGAAIEKQAGLALDEMRMAVDSLQPVHGDLGTVLATMRYRLQPRLEQAGLKIRWNVDHLPMLAGLTPQSILQVHRVLLEAMTNVLRHAKASTLSIDAHTLDSGAAIEIVIEDDGQGMAPGRLSDGTGAFQGHGLANMRSRAESIGAQLRIEAVDTGGTRVRLVLAPEHFRPAPAAQG